MAKHSNPLIAAFSATFSPDTLSKVKSLVPNTKFIQASSDADHLDEI